MYSVLHDMLIGKVENFLNLHTKLRITISFIQISPTCNFQQKKIHVMFYRVDITLVHYSVLCSNSVLLFSISSVLLYLFIWSSSFSHRTLSQFHLTEIWIDRKDQAWKGFNFYFEEIGNIE